MLPFRNRKNEFVDIVDAQMTRAGISGAQGS
jgi:hypothetical protein